jgi:hypothetical protein
VHLELSGLNGVHVIKRVQVAALLVQYVPDGLQFPSYRDECHDQEDNAHDQQGIDHLLPRFSPVLP